MDIDSEPLGQGEKRERRQTQRQEQRQKENKGPPASWKASCGDCPTPPRRFKLANCGQKSTSRRPQNRPQIALQKSTFFAPNFAHFRPISRAFFGFWRFCAMSSFSQKTRKRKTRFHGEMLWNPRKTLILPSQNPPITKTSKRQYLFTLRYSYNKRF